MELARLATVEPGKYVVAVSGGVDSMVLLDVLARQPELKLIVAHFDHGIREDSYEDQRLVGEVAAARGLPYIYDKGHLGANASEAAARQARYDFLEQVRQTQNARAIVTAHHQDDVFETAIINLLRGTGRKGLSSLQSRSEVMRPFLNIPKQTLISYAQAQNLRWREDSTNANERYLRNYVRRRIVPRLGSRGCAELLQRIQMAQRLNQEIDELLDEYFAAQPNAQTLDRGRFILLPFDVSSEVLTAWLRCHNIAFNKKRIQRLVVEAKTKRPGKHLDLDAAHTLDVQKSVVRLTARKSYRKR